MSKGTPPFAVLPASGNWQQVDFVSDLHLQAEDEATFSSWQRYLQGTPADAVFILGDLFDVWVGDDIIAAVGSGFENRCVQLLQATAQRLEIFLLHGNRDFLLGPAFAKSARLRLMADPSVLEFAGQRWLLSHGDALCLGDHDYLAFRDMVRATRWQHDFLAKPLAERKQIALSLRMQSQEHKRRSQTFYDLDAAASIAWLQGARCNTLIHGHTHRPAEHDLGAGLRRIVLSDWDANAKPPRAEVLRLSRAAPETMCQVQRLQL